MRKDDIVGLNAKDFAKKHRVNARKIKKWYDAGYLGKASKNETTGVYDIPEDTPLPYKADSRVKKTPTLWLELLDAAQNQCAVFPSMYPRLQQGTFEKQLSYLAESDLIKIVRTESGGEYLELCMSGYEMMNRLSNPERQKVFSKVNQAIQSGCSVIQAFCAITTLLQTVA